MIMNVITTTGLGTCDHDDNNDSSGSSHGGSGGSRDGNGGHQDDDDRQWLGFGDGSDELFL